MESGTHHMVIAIEGEIAKNGAVWTRDALEQLVANASRPIHTEFGDIPAEALSTREREDGTLEVVVALRLEQLERKRDAVGET